ncbi:MAG: YicC/YloC family endoribonuclease [Synergistaceae bacterium]|nr:YicC/YloC family endoribonuclease [Synergistaceae bacterium]
MYVSMTGFSRSQLQTRWGTLSLELSSVNHRYQEISVRLPREFGGWEPWFHQKLRKLFRRGKLQLRMEVLWAQAFKTGRLNKDVLLSYCGELTKVRRELGLSLNVNVEEVAAFPGVLDLPRFDEEEDQRNLESLFESLLADCAASWQKMRETEGGHLREELMTHLAELERLTAEIEEKWLPTRDAAFAAMKTRVGEMLEKIGEKLEEQRYMQEIVLLSDKWDVAEELARLRSHTAKFRATGDEAESSGRKLDFIIQEMNREVNTLDSKIADAGIRWLAVEAKACIERIREQIQNLE